MTTITVMVDKDKKPQYKDYVHFLGTFKTGKKSESDNYFSSSSSADDLSDTSEMPTKSFSEYMNDYNNKKYQPVHPEFVKKNERKSIKTEVFLQINNAKNEVNPNNEHQIKITFPKPLINEVDGEQINVSVGKLSQKFNANNQNCNVTPTNVLKRRSSITEKTKIFEEKCTITNKQNYNEKFPTKLQAPVKKSSGNRLNQTFVEIRKQELQNIPKLNTNAKTEIVKPNLPNNFTPNNPSEIKIEHNTKNEHERDASLNFISKEIEAAQESIVKIEAKDSSCAMSPPPPPPPPLPPTSLPPKSVISKVPNASPKPFNANSNQPLTAVPKIQTCPRPLNGYSTLPKMQNNKTDTTDSPAIDRNNPRVKKMVYGTLRDMYGAYHDKANDYIATLPKSRVKKGNGLDSIIDSIAAQGGLEKLCGRATPKSETDPSLTNI